MIRGKVFFTVVSTLSMALMLMSLLSGFIVDGYHGYYSPYYFSFAEWDPEFYWPLFCLAIIYIAFGIVAVTLYNKRIKAINIINLVLTVSVYIFAVVVSTIAFDKAHDVFAIIMFVIAFGIAFPLHLVAEIFALIAQKYKTPKAAPSYAYQVPVAPTPVATPEKADSNSAIEMLRQLKNLFDDGLLTEEEYNEKRKEYVSRI